MAQALGQRLLIIPVVVHGDIPGRHGIPDAVDGVFLLVMTDADDKGGFAVQSEPSLSGVAVSVALLFQQIEASNDIVFNLPVGVVCREVLLEPIPSQSDLLSLIGFFFRHD